MRTSRTMLDSRLSLLGCAALAVAAALAAAGCGGSKSSKPRTVFGGDRPVTLQVPAAYDGTTPAPLVILLHGYGVDGGIQEAYMHLGDLVDAHGVFLAAPDGTTDPQGYRFWNATDACCNFYGSSVDDVAYVEGLIHDIEHDYKIDPKRIFLVGHSNGGFMAHRMACDDAPEIAAIVSLAGAQWENASKCSPSEPVSVLQIHGTLDDEILYAGGTTTVPYPGAVETVTRWQQYDGCAAGLSTNGTIDLDSNLAGAETVESSFPGCPAGIGVELWTIQDGTHIPALTTDFPNQIYDWLAAHPKP